MSGGDERRKKNEQLCGVGFLSLHVISGKLDGLLSLKRQGYGHTALGSVLRPPRQHGVLAGTSRAGCAQQ